MSCAKLYYRAKNNNKWSKANKAESYSWRTCPVCQIMMIISLCTTNGADSHTTTTSPILCADGLFGAQHHQNISMHFLGIQLLPVSGARLDFSISCPSVKMDHHSPCGIRLVNVFQHSSDTNMVES